MSRNLEPELLDNAPDNDDADFTADDWTLDDFDDGTELVSLQSAWAGSNDRFE